MRNDSEKISLLSKLLEVNKIIIFFMDRKIILQKQLNQLTKNENKKKRN